MEARERDFLRANRHRITVGTTTVGTTTVGATDVYLMVETDDWEVDDLLDDDLTEDCEEVLGEVWRSSGEGFWRIIFQNPQVTRGQIEALLALI